MNATWTAYAASDLYSAGNSCDGHPFIAERFYVLIENARGTRFRHQASFNGAQRFVCEETGEPIGLKRLEARPIATLSIEAQERHEKAEKQFIDEE